MVCRSCGHENPEGARFCNRCAAELAYPPDVGLDERKVVSILFCDLVGFTGSAHAMDPEQVSRSLDRYHEAVRAEIERFGGRLEKFIGDAAMGVWGVPAAHEDDAERAVRAAVAIVDALDTPVRAAVNTGEAFVKLTARPELGEAAVAGDVVNTASRLQTVAPAGGVVVGEGTMRATGSTVEYVPLPPADLPGKPDPVPVWRVRSVMRATGRSVRAETVFVGRRKELRLLRDLFEQAVEQSRAQLLTLIGEPGIGKSRLVAEFERWIEERAEPATFRRGRCLAYGDGVGFWPLAEIVKRELGISERSGDEEARRRLEAAVQGMRDAPWLRARLAPLVGLASGEAGEREEIFTAWTRFFDELAARAPFVMLIEDLHWADPAMLAFVRHLAEWSTGAPLFIVCTARPELLERDPEWAGGLPDAITMAVRPLPEAEMEELAAALLGEIAAPDGASGALAARCGGNPLYAEEYARLLAEHPTGGAAVPDVPRSLQALIAARIDTLTLPRKHVLHAAAVIGKVFWAGAVASIAERPLDDVRRELHELARKELVRRVRLSSLPGDEEYAFWHDLVHEVCYLQIPHARRGELHRRAASWIEEMAGDRLADRAELLAYHYGQALQLLGAGEVDAEPLRQATVRAVTMATERAVGLDIEQAERLLDDGFALAGAQDVEYARLLCHAGACRFLRGHYAEARDVLYRARDAAEMHGDVRTIGEALNLAFAAVWFMGDGDGAYEAIHSAVERLRREPPSDQFAVALAWAACLENLRENWTAGRALCDEANSVAESVGDAFAIAAAREWRGMMHALTGVSDGSDDLEPASRTFTELGSSMAAQGRHQLAGAALMWHGPERARDLYWEAAEFARRTRSTTWEMQAKGEGTWSLFDMGEWDELLRVADEIADWEAVVGDAYPSLFATPQKAHVLALRGDLPLARMTMGPVLERSRTVHDPQVVGPTLAVAALIEHLDGNHERALRYIDQLGQSAVSPVAPIAQICRVALGCGADHVVDRTATGIECRPPRTQHALATIEAMLYEAEGRRAEAAHRYAAAAERWRAFGNPFERAAALAGEARAREDQDGARAAEEALRIFDRLGVADGARSLGAPSGVAASSPDG